MYTEIEACDDIVWLKGFHKYWSISWHTWSQTRQSLASIACEGFRDCKCPRICKRCIDCWEVYPRWGGSVHVNGQKGWSPSPVIVIQLHASTWNQDEVAFRHPFVFEEDFSFSPPGLVATATACRAQRWLGQETIQGGRGWQRCDGWRDCTGARLRISGMGWTRADWIASKYHLPTPSTLQDGNNIQQQDFLLNNWAFTGPWQPSRPLATLLPGSNAQRRGCWGCGGRCSCNSQPGGERLEPSREPWWHWKA